MINFSKLPDKAPDYDLRDLLKASCHFGHQKKKWHPHMAKFIYTEKDGVHLFDLAKTKEQLQKAYNYLYALGKEKKNVIFVGTKRQARQAIEEATADSKLMRITSRWLGGFLTNWDQINKSLKKMLRMEEKIKKDKYEGYTKYEISQLKKELGRLQRFFDGVRELKKQPDALVVVDPAQEEIAVTEAENMGVPVIALIDSNADPDQVDLPIPANDDSIDSVKLIVSELAQAYQAGRAA